MFAVAGPTEGLQFIDLAYKADVYKQHVSSAWAVHNMNCLL
jgi:hypothetical protein